MVRWRWNAGPVWCAALLAGVFASGCATKPIAGNQELRAFRGNVEQPWTVPGLSFLSGTRNEINTTKDSTRVNDCERILVYVRPAEVAAAVIENTSAYDADAARHELTENVRASAAKWGRFETVGRESEAELAIQARMSMLTLEGDAFRTESELRDSYKGAFGSQLSYSELMDVARDIMRTQITLEFIDLTAAPTPRGVHSSQITAFYARRKGEMIVAGAVDEATGRRTETFDGGIIRPQHLPLLMGQAVDAAYVDAFEDLDQRLWAEAPDPSTGSRPKLIAGSASPHSGAGRLAASPGP